MPLTRLLNVDSSRQYLRVPSGTGRECIFVAALSAVIGFSFLANARELLPFPSQQQQQRPYQPPVQQAVPQSYYLSDFKRLIETMTCEQLEELRSQLAASKRNAAAPADQEYFQTLISLVDQRESQRKCLPK